MQSKQITVLWCAHGHAPSRRCIHLHPDFRMNLQGHKVLALIVAEVCVAVRVERVQQGGEAEAVCQRNHEQAACRVL